MGWGTDFKVNGFLNRQTFKSIEDVDDKIFEIDGEIEQLRAKIKMYGSSTPKDITSGEWLDDPITFINNQMDESLVELEQLVSERKLLYLYKESLEDIKKFKRKVTIVWPW